MRVSVRREEICSLLSAHFGANIDDFVIAPEEPSLIGRACRTIVINPLDNKVKVGNIKRLRELAVKLGKPITLMEGKYALEHWLKWIHFVDIHNRLPLGGYGSGDGFGKLR